MLKIRPIIQVLGRYIKLPQGSTLDPETLGSGVADATKVLHGDGVWRRSSNSSNGYYPSGW